MIMIDLFAMLGSILLAILAAGLGLVSRLAGHSIKDHPLDLQALAGQIPAEDAYRPMARLFAQADLEFLRNQPGRKAGMERRLTLQRRRVLSIYLRQIRGDFHQMWNYCRLLIPISKHQAFGAKMAQQVVVFYGVYALPRIQCFLSALVYIRADAVDLLSSFGRLRQDADRVLAPVPPALAPATSWGA